MEEDRDRLWHRIFGLVLTDFFTNSPVEVKLEEDLSRREQRLDVLLLRRGDGPPPDRLPDGLEDLAPLNLITFKSHQEALDDWALKELTGHYVNVRKQFSPSRKRLLPETDFKLYAVCARYPHNLANDVTLEEVREGVYDCRRGTDLIRVIVAGRMPLAEHNAMLHLFAASAGQLQYGWDHYRQRTEDISTVLQELMQQYRGEGIAVSYTMKDFQKYVAKKYAHELTPRERLAGLTPEERLQGLTMEERREALKGLTPEERGEALKGLTPQERLEGLSPEEIQQFLDKLKADPPTPKGKARRKK